MDIDERVMELALKNNCCAQVVMSIGLELSNTVNADMIKAIRGLCYGVSAQHICGVLSSAACVLSLYDSSEFISELVSWFENEYDSVNCSEIVGIGGKNPNLCMKIMSETSTRCIEILEDNDLLPEVY